MKRRVYVETSVLSYLTALPATVHGLDFLLTWNCVHITNAIMRPRIEAICRQNGFQPPVICTPEELTTEEAT